MGQLQFVKIGAAHFHYTSLKRPPAVLEGQLQFVKIGAAHFHFPPPFHSRSFSPSIVVPLRIFLNGQPL